MLLLIKQARAINHFTAKKDDLDRFGLLNILQRIPIHQHEVRIASFGDQPDAGVLAKQLRAVVSGGLQRNRRRNASLHAELQFAMESRTMDDEEVAGIRASDQCHSVAISALKILNALFQR